MSHPVHLHVEPSEPRERIHVAVRLALLLALGAVGCSSLYWLLYLALPAFAALMISSKGGARYLTEDTPPIARVLKWLAAAYAYLWLLTDRFPTDENGGAVELELTAGGAPTIGSALLRLLYSLPALLVLMVLSIVSWLLWLIGAIAILVRGRAPSFVTSFFTLMLLYQFRLAAYHLSLVDSYPSFAEPYWSEKEVAIR
jgi:hypothetical protein